MKTLFFLFISFWLIFCKQEVIRDTNPGSQQIPSNRSPVSKEVCKDKRQCSSLRDCSQGESCIDNICEYPICISRTEACQEGCGFPNCGVQESDPSSIVCTDH